MNSAYNLEELLNAVLSCMCFFFPYSIFLLLVPLLMYFSNTRNEEVVRTIEFNSLYTIMQLRMVCVKNLIMCQKHHLNAFLFHVLPLFFLPRISIFGNDGQFDTWR